jgi:hypothetical protein
MSMSYITLSLYVCIRICIKRGDSLAKTNNAKKKRGERGAESRQETRHDVRCAHHTLTEAEITMSPHVLSEKTRQNGRCAHHTLTEAEITKSPHVLILKNAAKCEMCTPHTNRG